MKVLLRNQWFTLGWGESGTSFFHKPILKWAWCMRDALTQTDRIAEFFGCLICPPPS